MNQQMEMLARHRIEQQLRTRERSGFRRSARLIQLQIRASRRHSNQ